MEGTIFINGKDAYTTWGVVMHSDSLSQLMTPAGQKALVSNSSRLEHGKRVITRNPRKADRDLTLTIHIVAETEADFFEKYLSFCEELEINTKYQPDVFYRCDYLNCQQFTQYMRGMAKFILKLNEPNPADRGVGV